MRALLGKAAMGLAFVACLSGCQRLGVGDPRKEEETTTQEESSPPPEQAPASAGFAGRWTRDNGFVYEMTDDGTTVSGELIEGDAENYFSSYTLSFTYAGEALEGSAKFVFADEPETTYETAWKVRQQDDTTLVAEVEYLEFDDNGMESGRGTEEQTIQFEPAEPPPSEATEQPAETYTPPAVDMSAFVQVAPTYKYMLYEGIAVGHWGEVQSEGMGQSSQARTAVVGETDAAWIIEIDNQMNQKDLLLAVFVDKESGHPLKAFVGNRGQEGKEKEVPPPPEEMTGTGEAPQGEETEIEVPAGAFAATKYELNGTTSWVGREGDAEGVLLKSEGANHGEELLELEMTDYAAGDLSFPARRLKYESRESWEATADKPFLNLPLKMVAGPMTTSLVGQGTDAEPAFTYPTE